MVRKTTIQDKRLIVESCIKLLVLGEKVKAFKKAKKYFIATSPEYLFIRGWNFHLEGNYSAAIRNLEKSLIKNPTNYDAIYSLAACYLETNHFEEALECAEQCMLLQPKLAKSSYILAVSTSQKYKGDNDKQANALKLYQEAFDKATNERDLDLTKDVLVGWGACLVDLRRFESAKEVLEAVKSSDKYNIHINKNLASAYAGLNELDKASEACNIAAMSDNDQIKFDALYQLGMIELMKENYSLGWRLHEHRLRVRQFNSTPTKAVKQWAGEKCSKILVYQEQGIGDTIQFSRYINLVADRVDKVDLEVYGNSYMAWEEVKKEPKSLKNIMSCTYSRLNKVFIRGWDNVDYSDYDYIISLMSLPSVFKTNIDTIPQAPTFITDKANDSIQELSQFDIGLFWRGSSGHANDANRSIPTNLINQFIEDNKDLSILSLQIDRDEELAEKSNLTIGKNFINEVDDTLQLINKCKLIVSVDSMVAHLSASANKPVIILHAYAPDWRWGLTRPDSLWYPTVTNMRQNKPNDWSEVLKELQKTINYQF